jgi:NAD(P)H-flavin reductase/hemoglobin-like flavoprotein
VDTAALKSSFAKVARHGDQVPLFFYSYLFVAFPETRDMFPASMAGQRDKLVGALGRIVSNVDNTDSLVEFLQQLGRDHRKFGVVVDHYPAVGEALLATLAHFLESDWTAPLAADWQAAFGLVAEVMATAAKDASRVSPPWWDAEILSHERRSIDIAVLQIQPHMELDYLPGQSIAVESSLRSRLWRYYSPANAPRDDGTIEFHIRLVEGGQVSAALVQSLQPGDHLRLGSPIGNRLVLDPHDRSDLLLLAGGTGLAPLRALVEQVALEGGHRRVSLYVGAKMAHHLYDMPALSRLQEAHGWLTVVPAVSEDPTYQGDRGHLVDVALKQRSWIDHQVYVCGSPVMVSATVDRLVAAGISPRAVHFEGFGTSSERGGAA